MPNQRTQALPTLAKSASGRVAVSDTPLPLIVAEAGDAAHFAWEEYFSGRLRNGHTRKSYEYAVRRFLTWLEPYGCNLTQITPGLVGRYMDEHPGSLPTKKVHLSALRAFFDLLVMRHVMVLNPAASVRSDRYQVVEGKTPEMQIEQARKLLASIDQGTLVGLRDRAIIGVLIYTAARVGSVASLRSKDMQYDGTQYVLRFAEKNGKSREIPVRHDLQQLLLTYRQDAGLMDAPGDTPLFRTAYRKTDQLTDNAMTAIDMCRMVKRRLKDAGLPTRLSPHSFRVMAVTDLLTQGVSLEDVQYLAGHADPRTSRLYDRRQQRVTRNVVERISV